MCEIEQNYKFHFSFNPICPGTWDESDDTQYVSNISHQLSTLSIPSRYNANDPPKKKIKRRKSRKVKRVRVKSAIEVTNCTSPRVRARMRITCKPSRLQCGFIIIIGLFYNVRPLFPQNQNTSDDTVAEAMSTGDDTDSSMSLGAVTDTGN